MLCFCLRAMPVRMARDMVRRLRQAVDAERLPSFERARATAIPAERVDWRAIATVAAAVRSAAATRSEA